MGPANAPELPGSTPSGDPPVRACIARVYDAALGGTDDFPIDRQVLRLRPPNPVEQCIAAAVGRKD
jgi:hypothetical protein